MVKLIGALLSGAILKCINENSKQVKRTVRSETTSTPTVLNDLSHAVKCLGDVTDVNAILKNGDKVPAGRFRPKGCIAYEINYNPTSGRYAEQNYIQIYNM